MSSVVISGDTSGTVSLQAPTVAGSTVLTLPATSGTVLTTASGNAVSATTATTSTNLAGGSNGTIPYQSASGTTQMLAVGTSGQLLQTNGAGAPSWVTPSTGAVSLVNLTNLSASTTTVSVTIPSTYNGLYIVFASIQDTTSTYGRLRVTFNNDTGANYNGAYIDNGTWTQIVAQSYIQLKVGNSGSVAQRSLGTMTVFSCQSSFYKNTLFQTQEANPPSGSNGSTVGGCGWDSQAAITSVQFTNSSGSWASGQIYIYGYV
jgi:hypothetical protein